MPRSDGTLAWESGEVENFLRLFGIVTHGAREVGSLWMSVLVGVRDD